MGNGASAVAARAPETLTASVARELLGDAYDEDVFNSIAVRGFVSKKDFITACNARVKNAAFCFIKPHACNDKVKNFVERKLIAQGCKILSQGFISASEIEKKNIIDQHYYSIASKALQLKPSMLYVSEDKFLAEFGEKWMTVLQEGRAVNAADARRIYKVSSSQLNEAWNAPKVKKVKLDGGCYCALLNINKQQPLYVFNAFFPQMKNNFVNLGAKVYYFNIEFDATRMSWGTFRVKVLGSADPEHASMGSIRGDMFARHKELGLKDKPSVNDNGIHASASPFEGLTERMNWLGVSASSDPYGAALIRSGVSEEMIGVWSSDSRVRLPCADDSIKCGSVFDALEGLDAKSCIEKCAELCACNEIMEA